MLLQAHRAHVREVKNLMEAEMPDVSMMSDIDLIEMILACGMSSDKSDRAFAKVCVTELAKRKPVPKI